MARGSGDSVHRTYRSVALRVIGGGGFVVIVLLAGWSAVDEAVHGHGLAALTAVLWGALLAGLVAEVFLRPAVATRPEGVVLVNPFRTVLVPWPALRAVDSELVLQLTTDGGRHTSWAATGSRAGAARGLRNRVDSPLERPWTPASTAGPSTLELVHAGDVRTITPPLECRILIESGYQAWTATPDRSREPVPAVITWHRRTVAALAALAVATAAATAAL